jgi:hypothetical protein
VEFLANVSIKFTLIHWRCCRVERENGATHFVRMGLFERSYFCTNLDYDGTLSHFGFELAKDYNYECSV